MHLFYHDCACLEINGSDELLCSCFLFMCAAFSLSSPCRIIFFSCAPLYITMFWIYTSICRPGPWAAGKKINVLSGMYSARIHILENFFFDFVRNEKIQIKLHEIKRFDSMPANIIQLNLIYEGKWRNMW